jgi:hypothetical protein
LSTCVGVVWPGGSVTILAIASARPHCATREFARYFEEFSCRALGAAITEGLFYLSSAGWALR